MRVSESFPDLFMSLFLCSSGKAELHQGSIVVSSLYDPIVAGSVS